MKKYVTIVLSLVLIFSTVYAAPVRHCESEGEMIADDEDSSVYWMCSNFIPYKYECPGGYIFDAVLLLCSLVLNPEHENVCKPNEWGGRDCLRGSLISFRKRCPDGSCD